MSKQALVTITFAFDYTVDDCRKGTKDEKSYKAGRTYKVTPDTAGHMQIRGLLKDTAATK